MLPREHAVVTQKAVNRRMARVLVIDEDPARRHALAAALELEHHEVAIAATAKDGIHLASTSLPDLVFVDSLRDDGSSEGVCAALRRDPNASRILVMVLSSRASEEDRVAAFEAGADDYLKRPFSVRELHLRIRALLRRVVQVVPQAPADTVHVGTVRIDRAARRVTESGVVVALTRREFDLLLHLVDARGRVLARESIVGDLWQGGDPSERVVDTTLKRLRSKLPAIARRIRTIRGVGYELTVDDVDASET